MNVKRKTIKKHSCFSTISSQDSFSSSETDDEELKKILNEVIKRRD
jgi:hypothetical protein